MQQWRFRLALAPEDVVRKTFTATTQMVMNVEDDNRMGEGGITSLDSHL